VDHPTGWLRRTGHDSPGLRGVVNQQSPPALVSNKDVWSKTVVFITYDENGGFLDHVAPPVAPLGTSGEPIKASPLPSSALEIAGPLGLGFRVPMLVVSPFSRGGFVSSDVFDHTSQIRFLEERFGVRVPGNSQWRRDTLGDLIATLQAGRTNTSPPPLPLTTRFRVNALGCRDALLETSTRPTQPASVPHGAHPDDAVPGRRGGKATPRTLP
jgi:phospholipase C